MNKRLSILRLLLVGAFLLECRSVLGYRSISDEFEAKSENQEYVVRGNRKPRSFTQLSVYKVEGAQRTMMWSCDVEGLVEGRIFLSDDGQFVVAENHYQFVKSVLAFYGPDGVIKNYSVDDVLPQRPISRLRSSPSDSDAVSIDPRLLDPFQTSRIWEHGGSVSFLDTEGDALLFCLWIGGKNAWTAWNPRTGERLRATVQQIQKWNTKGRNWALKIIQESNQRQLPAWLDSIKHTVLSFPKRPQTSPRSYRRAGLSDAFRFLAKLKRPEDRKYFESMLVDPHFESSVERSQVFQDGVYRDAKISFIATSPSRGLGDSLLAEWDDKRRIDDQILDSPFFLAAEYSLLGVVRGSVELPISPTAKDGDLWIYLIPSAIHLGKWLTDPPVQHLRAQLGIATGIPKVPSVGLTSQNSETKARQSNVGKFIQFGIEAVTPGPYRIKAVWDKVPPSESGPGKVAVPEPGDYESDEITIPEVKAGATINNVTIKCTRAVKAN
jgi:hypothetical protein